MGCGFYPHPSIARSRTHARTHTQKQLQFLAHHDWSSIPVPTKLCVRSRLDRRHTETVKERKHAGPHTQIHPPAISHPFDCHSSPLTSRPAAATLDRSCRLSAGGVRQDARWDKHADTRSSAVATRRHPRCKCAAIICACRVDCLSVVVLTIIGPNTTLSVTCLPSPTEESRSCGGGSCQQAVGWGINPQCNIKMCNLHSFNHFLFIYLSGTSVSPYNKLVDTILQLLAPLGLKTFKDKLYTLYSEIKVHCGISSLLTGQK